MDTNEAVDIFVAADNTKEPEEGGQ